MIWRRLACLCLLIPVALSTWGAVPSGAMSPRSLDRPRDAVVDPALQAAVASDASGTTIGAVATLREQSDLHALAGLPRAARLRGVVAALHATATQTQGPI